MRAGIAPCGRGDRQRLDRFQFGRLGIGDDAGLQIELARLGRRQRFVRRTAGFLKRLEDGGGIGIENRRAWWSEDLSAMVGSSSDDGT